MNLSITAARALADAINVAVLNAEQQGADEIREIDLLAAAERLETDAAEALRKAIRKAES